MDSVLLQAHNSVHGKRNKRFVPLSIGAFRIIILLRNEILFIAFLVLSYQAIISNV